MTGGHWVHRTLIEDAYYPDHTPRKSSAAYRQTHKRLVLELDEPCWICGVRQSTLHTDANEVGAVALETHHCHLEWALANSVDPVKILADFPDMGVADDPHLRAWLDSEGNMTILCDVHHRSPYLGIHKITYPAWEGYRWQRPNWPQGKEPTL